MPIPDSVLGPWSHHYSGKASKLAHESLRKALSSFREWGEDMTYDVFLQGSYKNDTNLRSDSDVDLVVRLKARLRPRVARLPSSKLAQDQAHVLAHNRWKSFRSQVLKALKSAYGAKPVKSGRKSLKIAKGKIPADADVVVTLQHEDGIALFLEDEHRWVVSCPQRHHSKGLKKERATGDRYKRTVRMFKVARNHLVKNGVLEHGLAPSYFVECLLSNVPNGLYKPSLGKAYDGIVKYLAAADLSGFMSQNGEREMFGSSKELWSERRARRFIRALGQLWDDWT